MCSLESTSGISGSSFFSCTYASEMWHKLTANLLGDDYTTDWSALVEFVSTTKAPRIHLFLVRYVFQASIYMIWRERNARKHGESPRSATTLYKIIDRLLCNRLLSINHLKDQRFHNALQQWLGALPASWGFSWEYYS